MLTTKRLFLKRTLFAALACTAAAGLLSGCSKDEGASGATSSEAAASAQSDGGDLLARIKARGVVTIAMEGTWSPWTFHDAKGELTGFDGDAIELDGAAKIAQADIAQVRLHIDF